MAQKILIRRGPIANLAGAASSSGELLLATGVISDLTGPFLTMTGTSGTGTSTIIGKIYEGTSAPDISSNSPLTGLPFYSTGSQALIRLNHAGNQTLDFTGNIEGNHIANVTIDQLTGNLSIVANSGTDNGDLSVANDITLGGSLTATGDLSAANLSLSGNASITGNIVLGGNINIGDADTDTVTFGGEITSDIVPDLDSTYDLGSTGKRWLNIYVDALTGDTATLSSNATIGGTLGVTGATTLAADLGVGGNTGITGNLAVQGIVGFASTLEVTGATDFNDDVTIAGDLTFDGGGTQNITHTGATGNLVISSTNGTVELNGVLIDNDGNTQVPGTISTPNSTIGDDISIPGYLSVGGYANLGTGDVTDVVTISGSLDMNGNSTFSGNITLDGTSDQTITNTFGALYIESAVGGIEFTGNSLFANNLAVTGTTDFNNNITVSGDITLDGAGAQNITNSAGDLTIASSAGDVYVEGTRFNGNDVTVAGNLTVSGTTTTIDSTTVAIGDNIIELNAAGTVADGGIIVRDTTAATDIYGSMLWNSTGDYWYAGVDGSTHYRLATFADATPATSVVPRVDANKRLVAGSISDTGSAVTISSATTINGISDSSSTSAIRFSYINASKQMAYITPAVAGDLIQWNGSAMVASNVIDGGTF